MDGDCRIPPESSYVGAYPNQSQDFQLPRLAADA